MLLQTFLGLSLAATGLARSVPHKIARQEPSTTAVAPSAQSTICGDIIEAVNEGYQVFAASDVYECFTSVPFNSAVASRFIKYWTETLQFQSTLAYLKNPPEGYQQPAVDVAAELVKLQQKVDDGAYKNQYDFEADLQLLIYALKDGHVTLTAGILSAFSFGSPYEITSVSVDGRQVPEIYITDDLLPEVASEPWTPSPIATINGTEAIEFLTAYSALNSWGYIEPHAEWNDLMSHPTLDIQGGLTIFSGSGTFYPGENLTITFKNASDPLELEWLAIYNEPANTTGPLTTGGDFYNYFVLGFLPESFNATQDAADSFEGSDDPVPDNATGNWTEASYGAFPSKPNVAQYDLGLYHDGLVSGYFYEDISTGVLSIPSFDAVPDSIGNWSDAVAYFIGNASNAGLQKVVIDLERNYGGATLLAYLTFKLFFPELEPFGGSRRRSFDMANTIGSATTQWWDSLNEEDDADRYTKYDQAANEWVITDRINAANGRNFSGWSEYQGPVVDIGDDFSLVEQYDLANPTFDQAAFDQWYPTMYLPNKTDWPFLERKWNPDQIVLLTDGLCGSTCSLFVEMMTRVGVKTIVAGGRPVTGPMQAASGTRGARAYSTFSLDADMAFARSIDDQVDANVDASVPDVRDEAIYTKYGGFNLRDQIRKGETTPLQFKYEAADCRIYYTVSNIYNMTRLWHDVAAAAFEDSSLCVDGSQGFSTTNNTSPKAPPKPTSQTPILGLDTTGVHQAKWDDDSSDSLQNPKGRQRANTGYQLCPPSKVCDIGFACRSVPVTCAKEGTRTVFACLPACQRSAQCVGTCHLGSSTESKRQAYNVQAGAPQYQEKLSTGFCYPEQGTRALGCKYDPGVAR